MEKLRSGRWKTITETRFIDFDYTELYGKQIISINYRPGDEEADEYDRPDLFQDCLLLTLSDGKTYAIYDSQRSCCERRYMDIDVTELDQLVSQYLGSIEVVNGPTYKEDGAVFHANQDEDYYGDLRQVQFLVIKTQGTREVRIANYNEHNGYYGGFELRIDCVDDLVGGSV